MSHIRLPAGHVSLLQALRRHLEHHGGEAWLVGGYIRDLLLEQPSGDMDLAVDGDALSLARSFADMTGGSWVILDEKRNAARIVWPPSIAGEWPHTVDLARLRAPTIEDDLRGRDFTINAMAAPLDGASEFNSAQLIDPLGGIDDLRKGMLRSCGPQALPDDWLRMLRAVRFAAQLNFRISDELDAELRAGHALIAGVSVERVRDELMKVLALPNAGHWAAYLDQVGLLTTIIPELEPSRTCDQPSVHFLPVLAHLLEAVRAADWLLGKLGAQDAAAIDRPTGSPGLRSLPEAVRTYPNLLARLPYAERIEERLGETVDGVPRLALFKLAVLLHDVAKPQTKATKPDGGVSFYDHQMIGAETAWAVARRLRLSRNACDYVRLIVREHMRPGQLNELGQALTTRAVYRFFRATGATGPEVLLHSLCDHLAMKGPLLQPEGWDRHVDWTTHMLELFYAEDDAIRPGPLVRGDDLLRELRLKPGPLVGRLLEEVREAQAVGEVTTREQAIEWARRLAGNLETGAEE